MLCASGELVGDFSWKEDRILMGVDAGPKEGIDEIGRKFFMLQKLKEVTSRSDSAVDLDVWVERVTDAEEVVVFEGGESGRTKFVGRCW